MTLERDYGELPRVNCRPNQINQVLMNLLLNGIDAIEREPGRTGSVRIRTWRVDEDRVAVSVGDDGVGIPDENRRRIFEPGFSTKGGLGVGTGLGLPTCLSIIRNHGGTLAVQSAVGSGSTVTFELPISGPV